MMEPATNDDDDFPDAPLTLGDWIEVLEGDIDEAVDALTENEIEQLIRALRRKIDDIDRQPF